MAEKAVFTLDNYYFSDISYSFSKRSDHNSINLGFDTKGVYYPNEKKYDLEFIFSGYSDGQDKDPFLTIKCHGIYLFENADKIEDIPDYFYPNSLAILYPYIRSYASIITMQTNTPPIIIPTINLFHLGKPLRENTTVIEA